MMATWSKIRYKLENEYLAESLQGHIQYFVTTYSYSPDHVGRAAIRYNGKEIIAGSYYKNWSMAEYFPNDDTYEERMKRNNAFMDDVALRLGVFDQTSFYEAFDKFSNQSIEKSLLSENEIVRIFAILDRRVGKRRLQKIKESITDQSQVFQEFFAIRMFEEGLSR